MTMLSPFLRKSLLLVLVSVSSVFANSKPLLWNVPVQVSEFWGRKAHLTELQQKLTKGPVVVTGLSGVGKSQLTFAFARQNASKYRIVWVFDASKELDEQMIAFANKLYAIENKGKCGSFAKKEEAGHYVKTLLRTCAFSWLLIFDGAANAVVVKDAAPETHGVKNKHVLVSSLSDRDVSGVMRLEALSDAEAHMFLKHYLKAASVEDIAKLARLLENHPLALLQASSYINATPGMGVEAYITFFSKNKADYFASEAKALQGQPLLSTAIRMSIDKLKAASPPDYTVLVALCMLNTAKIESSLIEKAYTRLTQGDMGGFGKIQDVALISSLGNKTYKIHDYVRDVILMSADKETLTQAANLNAQVFLEIFPEKVEDCADVFEKNPAIYDHMKLLTAYLDDMTPNDAGKIGTRLLYFSEVFSRDYKFSVQFARNFKKLFDSGAVSDPLMTGTFYSWYGDTALTGGTVDEAINAFKVSYDAYKKANPEDARHELILLLADNLGFFHHWKGDLNAAQKYLNEAKALYEGKDDLLLEAAIKELDVVLHQDRGQFDASIKILDGLNASLQKDASVNKVAGHFVKSLKACSLLKLAEIEAVQNRQDVSKALCRQAYQVSQDAYKHALASAGGNEDAETVGRTLVYLSKSQSALGVYKDAEATAIKAIKVLDDDLAKSNVIRRQGVAHMALGEALAGQGRLQDAEKEYRTAQGIFEHISSHYAFDDMSELHFKIFELGMKQRTTPHGKVLMAIAMQNHKNQFDVMHPRFIKMTALSLAQTS